MRQGLKWAGWSCGGLVLLLGAFAGLLMFPGFLFAHKLEHRNLVVHSDEDLSASLDPVLRRIDRQLATSELNDPALVHHIYFGHGNQTFGAVQRARAEIMRRAIGVEPSRTYNASWPPYLSHIVTFDVPDAALDALRRPVWPGQFNMTHVLTHEVTHSLVFAKLGIANTARLPMWKAEGYPEYVATAVTRSQADYSLRASVARVLNADLGWLRNAHGDFTSMRYECIGRSYLKDEYGNFWHTCYYLSRVLVEYLLDRKGLTFDELAQPSVTDGETWRELLAAYRAGSL